MKKLCFGKVIDGIAILKQIENVETDSTNNNPSKKVTITECGQI